MTVSISFKMQDDNYLKAKMNGAKKQRPKNHTGAISAMGSDTSMSCVPANHPPPQTSEEVQSIEATATSIVSPNESTDRCMEYSAEEPKQACLASGNLVSASVGCSDAERHESLVSSGVSKDWQSDYDDAVLTGEFPNPPPSLVSALSSPQTTQMAAGKAQISIPNALANICITAVQCTPVASQCVQLSENVPVPCKTDVIARVSREALYRNEESLEEDDDEDSDVFASGEEWEEDKQSEYSTADEGDYEAQYRKKLEIKTHKAMESDIDEDENSSTGNRKYCDNENAEGPRTNAGINRDPCCPPFTIVGFDSEALKPVIVRQVSEDEDVKVTSDDDDYERWSQTPHSFVNEDNESRMCEKRDTSDECIPCTPIQDLCECIPVEQIEPSHGASTSPISAIRPVPEGVSTKCDDVTEPIRWSDVGSRRSELPTCETMEEPEKGFEEDSIPIMQRQASEELREKHSCEKSSRWKSLPTLPVINAYANSRVICLSASQQHVHESSSVYPTSRSTEQCSTPTASMRPKHQIKEFRARQAMMEALSICEEELGPVAVALAQLKNKVQRLNFPEINAFRRPNVAPLCEQSRFLASAASISSNSRTYPMMSSAMTATRPPFITQSFGGTQSNMMARQAHEADCVCRCCGLQVGRDADLSPVARMYILLAQSHRSPYPEGSASIQSSNKET